MDRADQFKTAYPEIHTIEPNEEYAKMMLENMGGRDSEMSAVSLYFYNHLITRENPAASEAFHRICMDEMRHLGLFAKLALQLGADPRLWARGGKKHVYWSPGNNKYPKKMSGMISNALFTEYMAIDKYTKQAKLIRDRVIADILGRVIRDEQEHVALIKGLLRKT